MWSAMLAFLHSETVLVKQQCETLAHTVRHVVFKKAADGKDSHTGRVKILCVCVWVSVSVREREREREREAGIQLKVTNCLLLMWTRCGWCSGSSTAVTLCRVALWSCQQRCADAEVQRSWSLNPICPSVCFPPPCSMPLSSAPNLHLTFFFFFSPFSLSGCINGQRWPHLSCSMKTDRELE